MSQHDNEPFNIEKCSLLSHFEPNDGISTCHRLQGSRCNRKICITDIDTIIQQDSNGLARRFLYTAITWSRNLNEIYLCKCDSMSTVKDCIENLIQGHVEQDRRRMFAQHRATVKEICDQLCTSRFRCPYCICCTESTFVLHRIDNLCHCKQEMHNHAVQHVIGLS